MAKTVSGKMEVLSTNIGAEKIIAWRGKSLKTGIYKLPVSEPIFLDSYGVNGDHVSDLKAHGGIDKACYAYGLNHYDHWKDLYPHLEWTYGMLGENLTISEIDEASIYIGDIYKIGGAILQVSQPRRPCLKLAAKFKNPKAPNQFVDYDHPGIYFRVIQSGQVQVGDVLSLDLRNANSLSLQQINQLLYGKNDKMTVEMAMTAVHDPNLPSNHKRAIALQWNL